MDNKGIKLLLRRTDLTIPFTDFLKQLVLIYPKIGSIIDYKPILEGYEDANFFIKTDQGEYVLKIFYKGRNIKNCQDYTRVLEESKAINFPTMKLVEGNQGFLSLLDRKVYFFITNYFQGKNFDEVKPSLKDMSVIARNLAILNNLNFPIEESYDSWGNKNLLKEFQLNSQDCNKDQLLLINQIIKELSRINLEQFTKVVIHGDLQRKHVLKNDLGDYCVLDFGCMSNAPKIIELSVYLAWFCLSSDLWQQKDKIIDKVINEYQKVYILSKKELDAIIPLIKASWAAYFFKTSILIKKGDSSLETKDWHDQSKKMLELSKNWQIVFN